MKYILFAVLFTMLTGCSHKAQDIMLDTAIVAPKKISITGVRAPWVSEIEKRLRNNGFEVKRYVSQSTVMEKLSSRKTEIYDKAASRYVLNVDGYAPNSNMHRCVGGGYKFNYINVEVIDLVENEVIANYSNNGYSENCPPLSGKIFSDIVGLISQLWNK
jgi:hypothetical protein